MCDWEGGGGGGGGGWGPIIIAYVRSPKWPAPNRTRKRTRNTIAMIGIARDLTQMRLRLFSSALYLFPLFPADAKSAFHSAVVVAAVGAGGLGRVPISFFGFQFQQVFHVRARNLCPASLPSSLSIPPLSQTTISEAISGTCNHAKFSLAAFHEKGREGGIPRSAQHASMSPRWERPNRTSCQQILALT